MTRNQLIELLNNNFASDEEVVFVYFDDQNDIRTTSCKVGIHKQDIINGHYEWLVLEHGDKNNLTQEWITLTDDQVREINSTRKWNGNYVTVDEIHNRMRWITDSKNVDCKKCIIID